MASKEARTTGRGAPLRRRSVAHSYDALAASSVVDATGGTKPSPSGNQDQHSLEHHREAKAQVGRIVTWAGALISGAPGHTVNPTCMSCKILFTTKISNLIKHLGVITTFVITRQSMY